MRLENLGPEMPGLFSTESVHKQGAGLSQASQIHKRDEHIRGQRRFIEHRPGKRAILLPLPPLRTGHDGFLSSGSSR